jgi:phosphatidate cytidylyltransferase
MTAAPASPGSAATPPTPSKFSDLRLRTLSSIALIAAVVGLLCLGHLWLLGAHVLVVFPLMIWEVYSLVRRWWPDRRLGQRVAMVSAVVIVLGSYMPSIAWLLTPYDTKSEAGLALYLYTLLLIILNDVGCYIGGRLIGGRKLAPSISPGKTISGSLCGIATVLIVFFLTEEKDISLWIKILFNQPILFWLCFFLVFALVLLVQAGDLLESYFKRLCNSKDSGHLIPGHGGVLDRLDSQLLVMPAIALMQYDGLIRDLTIELFLAGGLP